MMKRVIKVAILLCVVTILLSALSLTTVMAKATTPSSWKGIQNRFNPTSCGMWSVVPSPINPNGNSGLGAVAAVSATDIWAVGGSGNQMGGGQTQIDHWNGTQWQIVSSPNPSASYNTLYGVAALSASNVWAVGLDVNTSNVTQTLIEHWNGTQWSVVASPSPASVNNELFSVAAISASNVWAVGFVSTSTSEHTLIEHWNGIKWSVVTSPNVGTNSNFLSGVAAVSASNVWAVGASNNFGKTLVEHWNGSKWSVVTSPSPGLGDELRAVAVVSASNVWAVGYSNTSTAIKTLVEHWNGTQWSVVTSPNPGTSPSLNGVAAVSATDVWAVGSENSSDQSTQLPLIEHWNGSKWSVVTSPNPGSFSTQLLGVTAVSASNVWAVGHADSNPLIENFHC